MLQTIIVRIDVGGEAIKIEIRATALPALVRPELNLDAALVDGATIVLSVPAALMRTGMETKLLLDSAQGAIREPDRSLLRLLGQAHQYRDLVAAGQGKSMRALAAEAGVHASYFARIFRLAFLSPEIVHAILQGRHPAELAANKLNQITRLAIAWPDQNGQLGFP